MAQIEPVCAIHGITVFLVLMIFGMWSNTPSAMPVMPQACHRPTIPQETSKKMMMTFFWTLVKTGFLYHYVQPEPAFHFLEPNPCLDDLGHDCCYEVDESRSTHSSLVVVCFVSFVVSQHRIAYGAPACVLAVPWSCTHAKRARACIGAAQAPAAPLPNFALTALKNSTTAYMPK